MTSIELIEQRSVYGELTIIAIIRISILVRGAI
jgi:hypothetical protein